MSVVFLLGPGHQGQLWDVVVHKVKRDGVSSFALGVSVNNTQSDSSFHIVVRDLDVACEDVLLPVVFHDRPGFSGVCTCWRPMEETLRKILTPFQIEL